jgi:dipeptidyl aminopeptidase/acylaminoacyl peptidase
MAERVTDAEELAPETLARLPEFYHPVVLPGGDEVAFYHDESGRNELHSQELGTGERRRWSDGEVPRNARWPILPGVEGERVYFHRDEDGNEQNDLWAITPEGDASPVVEVDGQAILADVGPEGRFLLYASDEGEQLNLYRFDRETGGSEQVTAYEQPAYDGAVSPGGDRIAYVTNESDTLENRDVYVADADGAGARRLGIGVDGSEAGLGDWFPDGDRLLVEDNAEDLTRAGVYDLRSDEIEWLSDGTAEEGAAAVSPDGRYALATRTREAATMPVVYDLETGERRAFDLPEGVAAFPYGHGTPFVDETTVVVSHSTPDSREELLQYDLAAHEATTVVEATYGDVDPDVFVDAEHVTYESTDGLEIGALLYERDSEDASAAPGPSVVLVHGGPNFHARRRFNLYVQFLVSQGYSVLQPNYRGSTGRGREFKHRIYGDWGGMEQVDVRRGAEWLADRDDVDADRIAVFGGSFGGYAAYCQLTMHPEPWATGVAWIGITDLHRLYEDDMPHFKHQLRQQMGDPEEHQDLWRERSPIEHVDGMAAPVYILHGVNDPRCPVAQARLFRDALEERGWTEGPGGDFEYEELSEEGHGSTDVEQKVRVFRLLADYLGRRL